MGLRIQGYPAESFFSVARALPVFVRPVTLLGWRVPFPYGRRSGDDTGARRHREHCHARKYAYRSEQRGIEEITHHTMQDGRGGLCPWGDGEAAAVPLPCKRARNARAPDLLLMPTWHAIEEVTSVGTNLMSEPLTFKEK